MKLRKCRQCKKPYQVPSPWPACCSEQCKKERSLKLSIKKQKVNINKGTNYNRWLKLRYAAIRKYGNKCLCCGSREKIHVDHIKPRSKFPELTWEISNLQILCEKCNQGKGAKYIDDWRVL